MKLKKLCLSILLSLVLLVGLMLITILRNSAHNALSARRERTRLIRCPGTTG